MNEKITFRALIESIAEETGNSKQFTHDFLKDFVEVINDGLENDGNVNIAGFGKFKLRRVEEREGYNPQTKEKMTIPAHNKVVFKPYKDLRELVNAPYAHIEPQLLEDEPTKTEPTESNEPDSEPTQPDITAESTGQDSIPFADEQTDESASDQKEKTNKETDQEDFIPTAPTSQKHPGSQKDDHNQYDSKLSPFDFEEEMGHEQEEHALPQESFEDDDDIVEFSTERFDEKEPKSEDDNDDFLSERISSLDKEEPEQPHETQVEDVTESQSVPGKEDFEDQNEEDVFAAETASDEELHKDIDVPIEKTEEKINEEEVNKLEDTVEDLRGNQIEKEETKAGIKPSTTEETSEHALTPGSSEPDRKRSSAMPFIAAAAVILLLIAGGAWYYNSLLTGNTSLTSSQQTEPTTSTADAANQQDVDRQQPTVNSSQDQQQAYAGASTQNQSADVFSQFPASSSSQQTNSAAVEIEKGQTLWNLAKERYGNPRLWPWIYDNNGFLNDPDLIYAGSTLSVPLPSGANNTLNGTDSVGVAKGYIATYQWYKNNEEPRAKNFLWGAKMYHKNIKQLADIPIDQDDLSFANRAR